MNVLVLAEHDNVSLRSATLNTITAASALGGNVHVLVAGSNAREAAIEASRVSGVSKVWLADAPVFAHAIAEHVAAAVLMLSQDCSHLFFASTPCGKSVAPRVAALLGVGMMSDVTRVVSADTFERPIYAGNAIATVQCLESVKVATIRATAFEAAAAGTSQAPIESLSAVDDLGRTRWISAELAQNDRPELTSARVVVSGGRGLGSKENFTQTLLPLADKLGAALGASRAAVDAGYAPNDWQVGQTGKIVAPDLYVACGISGAIQHLAGMKDSKVIVAINSDPEAPIFGVANYGLEGDLFDLVPQLTKML
ncbi:MAG: FAD-binding protein [Betaproteobacteria bacterium]|nr:FAD-binding protein [Betaproteobacteria bacterium]